MSNLVITQKLLILAVFHTKEWDFLSRRSKISFTIFSSHFYNLQLVRYCDCGINLGYPPWNLSLLLDWQYVWSIHVSECVVSLQKHSYLKNVVHNKVSDMANTELQVIVTTPYNLVPYQSRYTDWHGLNYKMVMSRFLLLWWENHVEILIWGSYLSLQLLVCDWLMEVLIWSYWEELKLLILAKAVYQPSCVPEAVQ